MKRRLSILIAVTAAAAVIMCFVPPIHQNEAYHSFADKRELLGIPNCLNVLSNMFFLVVGVWGFKTIWRNSTT